MCPRGDDPLTTFTDYRAIVVTVANKVAAPTGGSFKLTFHDESLSMPAAGWTDTQCKEAFEALPNIDTVRCTVNYAASRFGGFQFLLQIEKFPVNPYQNNIYFHEGNPPNSAFACDTNSVVTTGSVTCTISDVSVGVLPGNVTTVL